jgi:hypothetical protein
MVREASRGRAPPGFSGVGEGRARASAAAPVCYLRLVLFALLAV